MRSVNKRIGMRRGDGPKALFGFHWLLFALVFAATALQVSPSKADPVDPTPFVDVTRTFQILGSSPPDTTLVKLVYEREGVAPDVTQFYFLIEPVDTDHAAALEPDLPPVAVIVLFVGGSGRVGFTDTNRRLDLRSSNFLLRQRWAFAAAGPFVVAVIDAARDFFVPFPAKGCSSGGGLRGCRLSTEHMIDVANVVQDLKDKFDSPPLPIWLVGTSRGTISAAAAAARLTNIDPLNGDGLVLTATLTDDPDPNEDVFDDLSVPPFDTEDVHLELIDVPVLIASHKDDSCFVTPPGDIGALAAALVAAPKVKKKRFKGGHGAISDGCAALSPHGFFGVEAKVIKKIAKFINHNI